jgi:tRNA(Ile)-lysidine synthase
VAELPVAVRRRVWRMLASAHGSRGGDLSAVHLDALDRLLSDWRGQGPVSLPGGLSAQRAAGILRIGPHRPASSG